MFCWKMKSKQLKFVVYQNIIYGFLLQSPYNSSHSTKTIFKNSLSSLDLPFLGSPKSHHHDSNQQEFKIKNSNAPWVVLVLNAMLIQITQSSYPLNSFQKLNDDVFQIVFQSLFWYRCLCSQMNKLFANNQSTYWFWWTNLIWMKWSI
jgi:hypothetical protein